MDSVWKIQNTGDAVSEASGAKFKSKARAVLGLRLGVEIIITPRLCDLGFSGSHHETDSRDCDGDGDGDDSEFTDSDVVFWDISQR